MGCESPVSRLCSVSAGRSPTPGAQAQTTEEDRCDGKRQELTPAVLAACFLADSGAVLALGVPFADFDVWLAALVVLTATVLRLMTRWSRAVIAWRDARVFPMRPRGANCTASLTSAGPTFERGRRVPGRELP